MYNSNNVKLDVPDRILWAFGLVFHYDITITLILWLNMKL